MIVIGEEEICDQERSGEELLEPGEDQLALLETTASSASDRRKTPLQTIKFQNELSSFIFSIESLYIYVVF